MSVEVEEDVELRDLVAQILESNGCLAKIRAELRASIFLALDEDDKINSPQPLLNKLRTFMKTSEGKAMFCLVREFLDFFSLFSTISIYDSESYLGIEYQYEGRQKVLKDFGLEQTEDTTVPVLLHLMRIAQKKNKIDINLNVSANQSNEIQNNNSSSINTKTDSNSQSSSTHLNKKIAINETDIKKNDYLNSTFDISNPTSKILQDECKVNYNKKSNNTDDDTYEDTSLITEDSVDSINKENSDNSLLNDKVLTLLDNTNSPNETEHKSKTDTDKPKLSPQKPEILRSKNSLSLISDLPSLSYSKMFKEKSNLKELDKMFDVEAEYEEDFICSSDELSVGQAKLNMPVQESSSTLKLCHKQDSNSLNLALVVNAENSCNKENSNTSVPLIVVDNSITSCETENKTKTDVRKPKSSHQKSKILSSKNSLSMLSDLPSLQLNKSKVGDNLPLSLNKQFKEKTNLKELDKMFDIEGEYEEDFICGDELSLGLLGQSKLNISSNEPSSADVSPEKPSISHKLGSEFSTKLFRPNNLQKDSLKNPNDKS